MTASLTELSSCRSGKTGTTLGGSSCVNARPRDFGVETKHKMAEHLPIHGKAGNVKLDNVADISVSSCALGNSVFIGNLTKKNGIGWGATLNNTWICAF